MFAPIISRVLKEKKYTVYVCSHFKYGKFQVRN